MQYGVMLDLELDAPFFSVIHSCLHNSKIIQEDLRHTKIFEVQRN